jgi:hypothetical protein
MVVTVVAADGLQRQQPVGMVVLAHPKVAAVQVAQPQ